MTIFLGKHHHALSASAMDNSKPFELLSAHLGDGDSGGTRADYAQIGLKPRSIPEAFRICLHLRVP